MSKFAGLTTGALWRGDGNRKNAACKWKALCRGGCRRDYTATGENYYCEAISHFFEDTFGDMVRIFEAWNREGIQ